MPGPSAIGISLTEKQASYLQQLCRRQKSPQDQIKRATVILKAGEGLSNHKISDQLGVERNTVAKWRKRWAEAASELTVREEKDETKELYAAIERVLKDSYRSGVTPKFSAEQVVQIIALACEDPLDSGRPLSHWTPETLAAEAVKRQLVAGISPQTVGRFLKGSSSKAAPVTLLADK